MKFPKESDDKEHDLVEFIRLIRFFYNLTINEVGILLMMFCNSLSTSSSLCQKGLTSTTSMT